MFKVILTLTLLAGSMAFAKSYDCLSASGIQAQLIIESPKTIQWFEVNDSAGSEGRAMGREEAPYSEQKGYYKFQLTDFYLTEDSSYILALQSLKARSLKAVRYFDNDDHAEQEEFFECVQK